MALFNFGKKQEEKTAACTCGCSCQSNETSGAENTCCGNNIEKGVCSIKVLGSGCKNCHTLLKNTKEAVKVMELDADIEYVTDMQKVMEYGVMSMPGLVVNEKVVAMGKVLKSADVEKLLQKLGF